MTPVADGHPRRTAVVTIAHGRHEHLRGQQWGLARQTVAADLHVVVAMDDPQVGTVAHEVPPSPGGRPHPEVVALDIGVEGTDLPLSRARNHGAEAALAAGADRLVFLDVDCIPAPRTLERYAAVLDHAARTGSAHEEGRPGPDDPAPAPVVACGTVAYLPPVAHPRDYRAPGLDGLAEPHPGRPVPSPGQVVSADDLRLFWSLSFAVSAPHWRQLGGFSEDYVGYGAEDTDFGQRIRAAGGTMLWVGGAAAYHQHHTSQTPPVHHLVPIVRNANVFRARWGWFPMQGWLDAFAERGLARHDPATGQWVVV